MSLTCTLRSLAAASEHWTLPGTEFDSCTEFNKCTHLLQDKRTTGQIYIPFCLQCSQCHQEQKTSCFIKDIFLCKVAVCDYNAETWIDLYFVPTTFATTGPEWKPARITTWPPNGSSLSTRVSAAAWTHRKAKSAIRATWSSSCLHKIWIMTK